MKKLILFLILFNLVNSYKGQKNLEYNNDSLWTFAYGIEVIQEMSLDSSSELYYPKLEKRFLNGEDIDNITAAVLIMGCTNTYEIKKDLDYKETLSSIVKFSNDNQYTRSNEFCQLLLNHYPLDLSALFQLISNYNELGSKDFQEFYLDRMKVLISGVLELGDGSINRPFMQLNSNDDEIITTILGGPITENPKLVDYEIICESEKFQSKKTIKINEVKFTNENGTSGVFYFCVNYVLDADKLNPKEQNKNIEEKNNEAPTNGLERLGLNENNPGVRSTMSGLQYKETLTGNGITPDANDRVTVHYHGTLTDGTIFDSSIQRGQPATFALNQVIAGWTEGLQLMKEGGKTTFYIPHALAYGSRAIGTIPSFSTLIYEVQLIKVERVD